MRVAFTNSKGYLFHTIPEARIISQAFLYELYELHKNALLNCLGT